MDWIATPHFFKNTRVIVLYLGCNTQVTSVFEAEMGPEFAGGAVPPITGKACGP